VLYFHGFLLGVAKGKECFVHWKDITCKGNQHLGIISLENGDLLRSQKEIIKKTGQYFIVNNKRWG
jgi:hypothetical protein